MAKNDVVIDTTEGREIIITGPLNAPRELVFKVWTELRHVEQSFAVFKNYKC